MTRKQLAVRVEYWRRRILPEWRAVVIDEPPDWADDRDEYLAVCQTASDYSEVRLHFTTAALERGQAEVDVTIVHELLHPLFRPMRQALDRISPSVAPTSWHAVRDQLEHDEEMAVDRLSRLIVTLDSGRRDVGPATVPGPVGAAPDAIDIVDHG